MRKWNQSVQEEIIVSDLVIISSMGEAAKSLILSDGAYVKPGSKKVVIQKEGYKSFSTDITVLPDENPFLFSYELEPL